MRYANIWMPGLGKDLNLLYGTHLSSCGQAAATRFPAHKTNLHLS